MLLANYFAFYGLLTLGFSTCANAFYSISENCVYLVTFIWRDLLLQLHYADNCSA